MVSFKNWNTIKFTNKTISIEDFDKIHNFSRNGISEKWELLVQLGKYGAINTSDFTKITYYTMKYVSDNFISHS